MSAAQGRLSVQKAHNAIFGFAFVIVANGGGGGTSPKTYAINNLANNFLLGDTDDNVATVNQGWSIINNSNANGTAQGRVYTAAGSPNNIALSQVSIESLVASYGRRAEFVQNSLVTSDNFNKDTVASAANVAIGDVTGIKRVFVSLLSPRDTGAILVNGTYILDTRTPSVELYVNNLGAIGVVNLVAAVATIGVHCELNV